MRRAALLEGISRGTVSRRLKYFGEKYRAKNQDDLSQIKETICNLQMDDLITKENSKLKPLSVTIAVNEETRMILGAKVSQVPAFGHLSKKAIETYGKRECHHVKGITKLFDEIQNCIHPNI